MEVLAQAVVSHATDAIMD